jgi:beta-N-acetylhexosaminidase
MAAIAQGEAQGRDVVAALEAGVDVLLGPPDQAALARIEGALQGAVDDGVFDQAELAAGDRRIEALRTQLAAAGPPLDLSVVRSEEHLALAAEVAARSITLVRDPTGLLPLAPALAPAARDDATVGPILAVMPQPADLTPADTSSLIPPSLAAALRRYHPDVVEIVTSQEPDDGEIAAIRDRGRAARAIVVGTIDAYRQRGQISLVRALTDLAAEAGDGQPLLAIALRGPWDVTAYPEAVTALATYSIHPASMDALAAVLAGRAAVSGRVPVSLA